MHDYISGIQQIGVGVTDAGKGMQDYKKMFGMNVLIFDDVAEAALMTEYTGGEVHSRRAALTMNLSGGGGFEIWQYKSRTPVAAKHTPQYGDYGIFSGKIKSPNVPLAYQNYKQNSEYKISELYTSPEGEEIARGLGNYAAEDARKIMRTASSDIAGVLGYCHEPELIHRDNLVLS